VTAARAGKARGRFVVLAMAVGCMVAVVALRPRPPSRSPVATVASDAAADVVLVVPHAKTAPVLDGEMTESVWIDDVVRTGPFLESGSPSRASLARPYSEARFSWGDGQLYVGLYASDEDIRATHDAGDGQVWRDDSFRLAFHDDAPNAREYLFDVSALGVLADGVRGAASPSEAVDYTWSSHARIGHDLEGSPNDPSNNDEEWVIEIAIPLASLGKQGVRGERIGLWVSRCDTPKGQPRTCGDWGRTHGRGVLVLD
jgi:hypothetical protein